MQKMHKFNDIGETGGEFSAIIVVTFVEKCKRKRTATLGSTGREREVIPDICHQIPGRRRFILGICHKYLSTNTR